jgi:uncharacterized protein (TIGR00251 family)
MTSPFTDAADGLRIAVRVTPRAKRSEIAGLGADAEGRGLLLVRLAAPPVEGAANKALLRFIAEAAGVPRSAVKIVSGEMSRTKMVAITGDAAAIRARLEALLPPSQSPA